MNQKHNNMEKSKNTKVLDILSHPKFTGLSQRLITLGIIIIAILDANLNIEGFNMKVYPVMCICALVISWFVNSNRYKKGTLFVKKSEV